MAIPELIEIVPLERPVVAEITVPGSKSLTNRALILAALAGGETTLRGALWSEDTQIMLIACGASVSKSGSAGGRGNRAIARWPCAGWAEKSPTRERPPAAGTFRGQRRNRRAVFGGAGLSGPRRLSPGRNSRMRERPQAGLFEALRELGYRVDSPNDRLPAVIFGTRAARGRLLRGEHGGKFAVRLRPRPVRGARLVAGRAGGKVRRGRSVTSA